MKSLTEKIKETVPTLVVFQHAGNQDAVEVKYLVKELTAMYGDRVKIVRVDSSYDGEIKMRYKLEEYPTWILFKEGQELMRESGRKTQNELEDMIQRVL